MSESEGGEETKSQLKGTLLKPYTMLTSPESSLLRGTLITNPTIRESSGRTPEDINEEEVSARISYLNETVAPLAQEYGGFGIVLGGSSPLSIEKESIGLNTSKFAKDPENNYKLDPDLRGKTFAKAWNTGADLNTLMREAPNDRYKFYLSLDLSSPQNMERAQEMFGKLLELAKADKISFFSKIEDHTYDNPDLYTWDREKLEAVIKNLYNQYPDIWKTTHHFFQAPIDGVDPMHVGWVQEPIGGKNGTSHSSRMGLLGKTIDVSGKSVVDSEAYKQACKDASVRPDAPWLITA